MSTEALSDTALYSTKDLQARWSKSADTIRGWAETGELRAGKIGNRLYVTGREVARFEAGLNGTETT